jgi:hypothetical protein
MKGGSAPALPSRPQASALSELLRRLPIICLEDAALHPAYPVIVWLMLAVSKDYQPPTLLIEAVLHFVADIGSCVYRDCLPDDSIDFAKTCTSQGDESADADSTGVTSEAPGDIGSFSLKSIRNDAARTMIASISLRATFGGMTGDMQMLDRYAQLWYERLAGSDKCGEALTPDTFDQSKIALLPSSYASLDAGYCAELLRTANPAWGCELVANFTEGRSSLREASDGKCPLNSQGEVRSGGVVASSGASVFTSIQARLRDLETSCSLSQSDAPSVRVGAANPFRATHADLVPEGVDQHVDFSLVPHLLDACRDKLLQYVRQSDAMAIDLPASLAEDVGSAIWLFRGASNSRKLYPLLTTQSADGGDDACLSRGVCMYHKYLTQQELEGKRRLAKLWAIICPVLVAYCERKTAMYARRL